LRIVCCREIPEGPQLLQQWNALALQVEQPQIFYTSGWALAAQSAYRGELKPLILLGYESNELLGVAALATDLAEENVTFLAATTADYCEFLCAPGFRSEFMAAVFRELREFDPACIKLANLPETGATARALSANSRAQDFRAFQRPAYACAQVELGCGSARQHLKTQLETKKKLRQYLRGMERVGPVTVEHLCDPDDIRAALPGFIEAHIARFEMSRRTSSLTSLARRSFVEELTNRFAGKNVITLSVMKVADQPAAWNYGFRFQGSWFWYQPTFDSRLEQYSPGYCLLSKIIIEACSDPEIDVVDLGLGAEGYKARFGNSVRHTVHATLTRSLPRHVAEIARYRTAGFVRRSPRAEAIIRAAIGGVKDARSALFSPAFSRPPVRPAKTI